MCMRVLMTLRDLKFPVDHAAQHQDGDDAAVWAKGAVGPRTVSKNTSSRTQDISISASIGTH